MNTGIKVYYGEKETKVGEIFTGLLEKRGITDCDVKALYFGIDTAFEKEQYSVSKTENGIMFVSGSESGLIFAIGRFLRKIRVKDGKATVLDELYGTFKPEKSIRGHQIGYRDTTNTYDAWDEKQYYDYMLEMMLFGTNTVEFIPDEPQNELMIKDARQMLMSCIASADELGLYSSLWYPNDDLPAEQSAQRRRQIIGDVPSLDVLFIPGSDPGDYPVSELMHRVKLIAHEVHKVSNCQILVSAQAPHDTPQWGDDFIAEMEKLPEEIDGVIMGPNHAMCLPELRQRVPDKYPIRLYNDITHNVRCEYPVHYYDDDWHFSCAVVNGRESTNPRPVEFARLHRECNPYVAGSCSYSEGINDDFNKMLWTVLDFDESTTEKEIALDYSRLFFTGADEQRLADGIFGLERNWDGDTADNAEIDKTYGIFKSLSEDFPFLNDNWRFNILLFRAECDMTAKIRRVFELTLIEKAKSLCENDELSKAVEVLKTDFSEEYKAIRQDMERLGALLFDEIGYQLDVKRYHAKSWERGAVLESADLPVSDRPYLLSVLEKCNSAQQALSYFNRNKVADDEIYYSVALHGKKGLGLPQKKEVYLNFRGDNPNDNDGTHPMCIINIFDSWNLSARFDGLSDGDYVLKITYTNKPNRSVSHHEVNVNGHVLYHGMGYGGTVDTAYTEKYLCSAYVAVDYDIPAQYIENGVINLEISEPTVGFEISEMRIIHK